MPAETGEKTKIARSSQLAAGSFLLLAALVFLADRFSKIAALHFLSYNEVAVIPGIFHFTLVQNTGAAFCIFKNEPKFLIAASLGAVLTMIFLLRHRSFAWALVIGGALGNLYDRLRYGHVIDFLDFRVWPVFNLADAAICVGVALILWDFFKHAAHSR